MSEEHTEDSAPADRPRRTTEILSEKEKLIQDLER